MDQVAETLAQDVANGAKKPRDEFYDTTDLGTRSDPLLDCLLFLTSHYGHARSVEAIAAGLPIGDTGMTPAVFCSAAHRVGFNAKIARRNFDRIPPLVLPAVLILKGRSACVLVKIDNKKNQARVVMPEQGSEMLMPLDQLRKNYAGYAIFVHPQAPSIEEAEETEKDPAQHWFWGPVLENKSIYLRVAVASVLVNFFALTSPLFVMNVYDRVLPNNAIETGWVLGLGALTIFAFDFVIRTLRGYFIDLAGRRADVIMAQRLYDQVLDMKLAGKRGSTGAFANNLKEFESIRDFFTSASLTGLVDLPFSFLFLLIIWMISPPIAAALIGLFVAAIAVNMAVQVPVRHLVRKSLLSAEAKHGLLIETINGLETIKGVGGEGRLRKKYGAYVGETAAWGQKSRFVSAFGVNFASWVQQIAGIISVLIGMYLVQDHKLTVGALIATVILSSRAISPVGQVASLITRYHHAAGALKNLNRIMALPVERPAHTKFLHRPELKGGFHFQGVKFSYPGRSYAALEDISFHISPGEKVGLVGRVGSGKSTLTKLMVGFYDPQEGKILVDDTDMRQIDPADLRRNIAFVAQDAVLFSGTVRENITVGRPDATDEEIFQASIDAGVHDFIRKHPMGYDAPVGERGEGFSGGQRQAIALARAILANPPVLICDEPTNAMDMQAEQAFIEHAQRRVKNKTLILVTHKPSLLKLVDRLILIDGGRVYADGPREKVIEALNSGQITVPK